MTKAVVLGGGGVAGIAWELGVLRGLADEGVDVSDAGLVVGTSAGSVVGAQLRSSWSLAELYDRQLEDPRLSAERLMEFDMETLMAIFTELSGVGSAAERIGVLTRVGAMALAASTPTEAERLEIIRSRLPDEEWPTERLVVTAVDANAGDFVTFDRDSGVSVVDAIAASCAAPGVWPPATIGDRRFIDGGARSATNADLAVGCSQVLVVAPMGAAGPVFDHELELLAASGAEVLVVVADETSTAAFGMNPLDPATRPPSARAGRAQGVALAGTVRPFWIRQG